MSAPPHQTLIPDHRRRLVVFAFLMAGVFMATLDVQIIATALPTIVGEFGHLERFGWIGSAYLLTASAVMPIYGKLGDLFGRKYTVMAAITLFVLGSLTCGLAVSMDTLIAARVLQALGGGGIMVSIFAINADLFEPRERAKYQSYSSLMLMASGFIGPVLGGTMSDLFGWRSIFLINLPLGAMVLLGLGTLFPAKRPDRKPKIDYAGALLLAGVTTSIVLWADGSELFGGLFSPQSLAVIGAGALCLVLWVQVEKRAPEPVIPLHLFSNPTITRLLIISITSGSVGIGMVNYIALYLQSTLSLSPTAAGLFFIPLTGGIAAGSVTAGRIMSRTGRYKIFSVLSTATSMTALLILTFFGPGTPLPVAAVLLLIYGIGIGVGQQVPLLGIQNAADRRDVGAASGSATLTRMGGASIAISIYGAIVAAGLAPFAETIPGVANLEKLSPDTLATLTAETQHLIGLAYQQAFHPLFMVAAGYALIGLLTALSLKNVSMPARR